MKSRKIRLAARLVFGIGMIAGLLGCIAALLLYIGVFGDALASFYQPEPMHFAYIGGFLALIIIVTLILHACANKAAAQERILNCWNEAEKAPVTEEPVAEAEVEPETEAPAEVEAVVEAPAEEATAVEEAPVEEAPKTKLDLIRNKILEKAPISKEQLDKAEKVGKVALPIVAACVATACIAKVIRTGVQTRNRHNFYKWLG